MAGRSDPFDDLEEIIDVMTGGARPTGNLQVDLADTGDAFVVVADLPGYEPDDLDVKLTDKTTLSLAAERDTETVDEVDRYVMRERTRESVSRTVALPGPVDETETEASFNDGVLTVRLPKRSEPDEGTDIPVN